MKNGKTPITLIIGIATFIILGIGIIIFLNSSNYIERATEKMFKDDIQTFILELEQTAKSESVASLYVDIGSKPTIGYYIPSMSGKVKYHYKIVIADGKVTYTGTDKKEKKWANEIGIQILDAEDFDYKLKKANELNINSYI